MRNTSLQTLPEGWDKSLQDLEDGFSAMRTELTWIWTLEKSETIKSIWTCLIIYLKVSPNFHLSTWRKFEWFSFKIIFFWNQYLIQFSISWNQGRFRTFNFLWLIVYESRLGNWIWNRNKSGNSSYPFMQYKKLWCAW